MLPGFKTSPGLSTWKVMTKHGIWVEDFASIPKYLQGGCFTKSMFSPTPEEAEQFKLHLCHRVLPHHNDTGGFFFATLRKVTHLPWTKEFRLDQEEAARLKEGHLPWSETARRERVREWKEEEEEKKAKWREEKEAERAAKALAEASTSPDGDTQKSSEQGTNGSQSVTPTAQGENLHAADGNSRKRPGETGNGPPPKKQVPGGFKEDPFLFLKPDDPVWPPIQGFYGLTETFPSEQLLYRSEQGAKRSLYFVSKAIRQIVLCNENRVKFVNMGVKSFSRSPSPLVPDCDFRLSQEGMGSLAPHLLQRTLTISREDAVMLFKEENPFTDKMCQATQDQLQDLVPGSVVFVYKPTESNPEPACELTFCGWKGKCSVRTFVAKHDRAHSLRLFGRDIAQIQADVEKMKRERAVAAADQDNSEEELDKAIEDEARKLEEETKLKY